MGSEIGLVVDYILASHSKKTAFYMHVGVGDMPLSGMVDTNLISR